MIRNILTGSVILGVIILIVFLLLALADIMGGWFFVLIGGFIFLLAANWLGDVFNSERMDL